MNNPSSAKATFSLILILGGLLLAVIIFSKSILVTIIIGGGLLIISAVVALSFLRSYRAALLISKLYESESVRGKSPAPAILTEILTESAARKSLQRKTSELIHNRFRSGRFAVFFKAGDKYLPRLHFGIDSTSLKSPKAYRMRYLFKEVPEGGSLSTDERIVGLMVRKEARNDFESPIVFLYRWSHQRSMIFVAEDPEGLLADVLKDSEFNRLFWPVLDSSMTSNHGEKDTAPEVKRLKSDLSRAKQDLFSLNKELNKRSLDLNSFVRISGDLYSIFNEQQLFGTLKRTVCAQLGAADVEILFPSKNHKFAVAVDEKSEPPDTILTLDTESEFFKLLAKNPKPVLLPLIGSGLKHDEPFLGAALRRGYQVAIVIRVGNQIGCILLASERKDKTPYDESGLDFLSIITNIASLSLENIRQYSTIEKLSYTDGMTGIYNYRYFYKRLNEEVFRAKRYGREISLVILDIDNFKLFNDKYDHQTGDKVLKRLAGLIMKTVRSIDVVSRYGGEEFCIIMPDTNEDNCNSFIERLRNEIAGFRFGNDFLHEDNAITVSVGGAVYPHHANTPDRVIYCADMALLKAKSLGRNRAIMYKPDFIEKEKSSIRRSDDN